MFWSLIAALTTMLIWGVNFAVSKYVLEGIGPGPFMFFRFTLLPVLGVVLLAIAFRGRLGLAWPRRADMPRFVACAFIGHAVHIGAVLYGMNLSTAFSSSLVLTTGPLFTLAILAAVGAERLRVGQLVGTGVACAGMALFLSEKFVGGFAQAGFGDLLLLVAALCFSLYTVLVQPLVQRYGPLIVLSHTLVIAAPLCLLVSVPSLAGLDPARLTPGIWVGMLWALVMSSFFGWLMWTWVNAVRGVARSAPFAYLMPPIAGLVAWLTLGESFTWLKIFGAALTMAGVAWAQFGAGAPAKAAAQPDAA